MKRVTHTPALLSIALGLMPIAAQATSPSIDTFNVQSYIRLANGSPTSATSGNFVFGIFKGGVCIWAQRNLATSISTGMLNFSLIGAGSNIASINNPNATAGECVANFSGTTLNSTLLNSGGTGELLLRVYSESTLDSYQPIWDIPMNAVATAMVADAANTATSATTANDLIAGMKVTVSAGAPSAGKYPILNASGKLDVSFINQGALSLSNGQITGLGTASTVNTGTATGNVPVLNASGLLNASLMPTYTANRVMATNGAGTMSGAYQTTTVSAGAGSSGMIPLLNASGKIDNTAVDSTLLTPNPANLSTAVAVNKGGTGLTSLTSSALVVGNGAAAVSFLSPTNGNIVYGSGGAWTSSTAAAAGIVDTSNTQTITGAKTWNNSQAFNGTMTLGASGATYTNVLQCNITSAAQTSGTETTAACAGATTSATVFCSPTVAPSAFWLLASARISSAGTIAVMPLLVSGGATWTTAFNCVVFQP